MTQHALTLGGFCLGPLFAPIVKRRPAKRTLIRNSGGKEVWAEWSRTRPPLEDKRVFYDLQTLGRIYTAHLGVQHSVDHIVPLNHPLVCGLHRVANFEVLPLVDNVRKSNNWWPGMPETQGELWWMNTSS